MNYMVDPSPDSVDAGYGWDWSATTHSGLDEGSGPATVVRGLLQQLDPSVVLPGKGLQGWQRSARAFDSDGFLIGQLYYGGRDDVHLVSTGSVATEVRAKVSSKYQAKTSRVDTRFDSCVKFEDLEDVLQSCASASTLVTEFRSRRGDVSTGRTLYVGSPRSAVRVRLYEKWLESPGQYPDGTNRVEVQFRPPSRAKQAVSSWTTTDTFCASLLTRRVAEALGGQVSTPPTFAAPKRTPDLQKSLEAMGRQYGRTFRDWMRVSGGDLETALDYLEREAGEAKPF